MREKEWKGGTYIPTPPESPPPPVESPVPEPEPEPVPEPTSTSGQINTPDIITDIERISICDDTDSRVEI